MRPIRFLMVLLLALLLPGYAALANVCRSIQAELAAIGRGPSSAERSAANRNAVEAQRIFAHMRAIGCERGGLFSFGAPPPPECPGLRARMYQLQQSYQPAAHAEGRRRELMSMLVSYNCRTSPDPGPRSQPLVAGLFDDNRRRSTIEVRPDEDIEAPRVESRIRGGVGNRVVCVRSCDGYYFPAQVRPDTPRNEGDQICQSLCPATEARMYSMRTREIETAISFEGETYADHPNAFLYRKRFDPACFCRRPGETWGERNAQVLNPDAPMGPGFDTLNPVAEPPEDLPLRGFDQPPGRKRDTSVFGNRPPPEPPAPPHPPLDSPTDRTMASDEGEVREFTARDGSRRSVRIIAPGPAPAPAEARVPSGPDRAPAP